jgi:hypothetical protein
LCARREFGATRLPRGAPWLRIARRKTFARDPLRERNDFAQPKNILKSLQIVLQKKTLSR